MSGRSSASTAEGSWVRQRDTGEPWFQNRGPGTRRGEDRRDGVLAHMTARSPAACCHDFLSDCPCLHRAPSLTLWTVPGMAVWGEHP
jgi:hypothetical protein